MDLLLIYDAEHKLLIEESSQGYELPSTDPTGGESLLEAARRLARDKLGPPPEGEPIPDPIYQPKLILEQQFDDGIWTFHYFAMRGRASPIPGGSAPNTFIRWCV